MSDEHKPTATPSSNGPGVPPSRPASQTVTDALKAKLAGVTNVGQHQPNAGAQPDMGAPLDHDPGHLDPKQLLVAAKEAQLDAANDKVLRSYADLDNMRKRVEREKEDTAKYAITKFARDIVNVADNFERAILSVPAEAKVGNAALNSLIDGVSLTEREFLNVLERHGVKRVAPQGEPFNPHHHQAVMEQPNLEVAPGTVLQVFQPGYLIDDRVLRPAMVVVATGGPKPPKPSASSVRDASNDGIDDELG
jgi:molecular chaperone GrpE